MRLPPVLIEKLNKTGDVTDFFFVDPVAQRPVEKLVLVERLVHTRSLAIIRDCGIGDLLMLTPTLKYLRAEFPKLTIDLFSTAKNIQVLAGCPYIDNLRPTETLDRDAYDTVVDLCGFVERHPQNCTRPRAYLFGRAFDIHVDDLELEYWVDPMQLEWAKLLTTDLPKPWIGIAPYAHAPQRDWKRAHEIIPQLEGVGSIFWFSAGNRPEGVAQHISSEHSVSKWGAAISLMDMMVCTDSGPLHLAQAIQGDDFTPMILALFGVGGAELLMPGCKSYMALGPEDLDCHPCMHGLVSHSCVNECMLQHDPQKIADLVKSLI